MQIYHFSHAAKTNPIKPNFRQEMPKMTYLPSCLKLHYIGTVKAIQLGTSHNLIAILVMGKSRINRRVFYLDSPCCFGYSISCFIVRLIGV